MVIDPFDHAATQQHFLALLGSPPTPAEFWPGFLAFAREPLKLRVAEHPDNDILVFSARDQAPDATHQVAVERRIGLHEADLDYCGTTIAACWLTVSSETAWEHVAPPVEIQGHGASAGPASDVAAFRAAVEASDAFAALCASSLVHQVASLSLP